MIDPSADKYAEALLHAGIVIKTIETLIFIRKFQIFSILRAF